MNDAVNGGTDQARQQKAAADKAVADARAAQTAADQAAAQFAEWSSPLSRQQREAQAQQAVTQAGQATAAAQQAQVSALIPDFSKVTAGTTTIQGDQPLFGSALARKALEKAVRGVAEKVVSLAQESPLLLTTSADLASSDAAYGEVMSGLTELTAAATAMLNPAPPPPPSGAKVLPVAAVAGAVASALPPLLSLLAPQRTLSGFAVSADATAALALLAGRLAEAGRTVRIDDFRTVPQGRIYQLEDGLRTQRTALVQRKLERDAARVQADNLRASSQAEVDDLTKTLDGLTPSSPGYDDQRTKLQDARKKRDDAADDTAKATAEVGAMTDLQTSIDTFLTAIHAVPAGGNRSAYTLASLREDLHAGNADVAGKPATRVVFLSAAGGSGEQLLDHRPLMSKDKFEAIASVSVSYWVLDPATGTIIGAGNAGGTARLQGSIGGTITIESIDG
jgi:hypothetical protein